MVGLPSLQNYISFHQAFTEWLTKQDPILPYEWFWSLALQWIEGERQGKNCTNLIVTNSWEIFVTKRTPTFLCRRVTSFWFTCFHACAVSLLNLSLPVRSECGWRFEHSFHWEPWADDNTTFPCSMQGKVNRFPPLGRKRHLQNHQKAVEVASKDWYHFPVRAAEQPPSIQWVSTECACLWYS